MEDHREMRWEVNMTSQIIGALYRDLTWEQAQSEGMTWAEFVWGKMHTMSWEEFIDGDYVPDHSLPPGMPKDEAAQVYALCRLFRL